MHKLDRKSLQKRPWKYAFGFELLIRPVFALPFLQPNIPSIQKLRNHFNNVHHCEFCRPINCQKLRVIPERLKPKINHGLNYLKRYISHTVDKWVSGRIFFLQQNFNFEALFILKSLILLQGFVIEIDDESNTVTTTERHASLIIVLLFSLKNLFNFFLDPFHLKELRKHHLQFLLHWWHLYPFNLIINFFQIRSFILEASLIDIDL